MATRKGGGEEHFVEHLSPCLDLGLGYRQVL